MKQNTADWLAWRRKGLGASDSNVIMGVSEYQTRLQLFENKLELRPDEPESFITELGHRFEPLARAQFELLTGIGLKSDVCLEHPEFKYIRASFDGYEEKERVFAEVKMVGREKMNWIKANKKPLPGHMPQVQHQFLVSGFERGFYIAYRLDDEKQEIAEFTYTPVAPDRPYIDVLFKELTSFWNLVQAQEPPALDPRDAYTFKDQDLVLKAHQYQQAKAKLAEAEKLVETLGDELKKVASVHAKVSIGDLTIKKMVRKGNVDYAAVPELRGVNVEPYRKAPSVFQQISVPRAK